MDRCTCSYWYDGPSTRFGRRLVSKWGCVRGLWGGGDWYAGSFWQRSVETAGARVALASVHHDVRPGDPRCSVREQEGDHVGDLVRAAQPPERELGAEEGSEVVRILPPEGVPG